MITASFRDCVIAVPTRSPIGVIARSAPSVKNIIPTTSSTAPIRNTISNPGEIGAIVKHRNNTIRMIGMTARSASSSFSSRFVR